MKRGLGGLAAALSLAAGGAGARAPEDAPQTAKQLEERLFAGVLEEAEAGAERLLRDEPGNVDALMVVVRARRWSGRALAARAAAEAALALALAPERGDVAEELAWTYAAVGRGGAAEAVLGGRSPHSEELRATLARLKRPRVSLGGTYFSDSNGVLRLAPRLEVGLALPADARLRVGMGLSQVTQWEARLTHPLGGLTLEVPLGGLRLEGGWVLHRTEAGASLHEGHATLKVEVSDGFGLEVGGRRRPFVESAASLTTGEGAFHGAGAGGALHLASMARRGVDELRLLMRGSPVGWSYAYLEARAFTVSDANRGAALAAGVGADVVRAVGLRWPLALELRWDTYATGFTERRAAYFSPELLDVHSPGAALRWRMAQGAEAFAEGGYTFPLLAEAMPGWYAGGGLSWSVGQVRTSLRAQVRDDPWFRSQRLWAAVELPL